MKNSSYSLDFGNTYRVPFLKGFESFKRQANWYTVVNCIPNVARRTCWLRNFEDRRHILFEILVFESSRCFFSRENLEKISYLILCYDSPLTVIYTCSFSHSSRGFHYFQFSSRQFSLLLIFSRTNQMMKTLKNSCTCFDTSRAPTYTLFTSIQLPECCYDIASPLSYIGNWFVKFFAHFFFVQLKLLPLLLCSPGWIVQLYVVDIFLSFSLTKWRRNAWIFYELWTLRFEIWIDQLHHYNSVINPRVI